MSRAQEARAGRRLYWFVAMAGALALLFVRLGIWQLDRLDERRALNAKRRATLEQRPGDFTAILRDSVVANRQVILRGTPDYANDLVLTGRSRNGSPGVHIVTPVRVPGSDTAVLVNRGWVYAGDAATVDLARWREARETFTGYTRPLDHGNTPASRDRAGRAVRTLTREAVRALVPYPIHEVYVVSQDSAPAAAPARLPHPDLGEGPHLGYAIQWFAFAAVAIVGAGIVIVRGRTRSTDGPTGA